MPASYSQTELEKILVADLGSLSRSSMFVSSRRVYCPSFLPPSSSSLSVAKGSRSTGISTTEQVFGG